MTQCPFSFKSDAIVRVTALTRFSFRKTQRKTGRQTPGGACFRFRARPGSGRSAAGTLAFRVRPKPQGPLLNLRKMQVTNW